MKGKDLRIKLGEKQASNRSPFPAHYPKTSKIHVYLRTHGCIFITAATIYSGISKTRILFLALYVFVFYHLGHVSVFTNPYELLEPRVRFAEPGIPSGDIFVVSFPLLPCYSPA